MDWARWVYLLANWAGWIGGAACLVGAVWLVVRPAALDELRERQRRSSRWGSGPWAPLALAAAACGAVAAVRLAMFAQFQLTSDSGVIVNYAWNFAHGNGLLTASEPPSHLAYHFSLTSLLLSPVLWIWESAGAFSLLQGLALGALVPGAYLLARRHSDDPVVPWLAALLALSHPIYQNLAQTIIEDSVYAAPLFIWSAYLWHRGNRAGAIALGALILTTKEEAPLIFIGLGLHMLWSRRGRSAAGTLMVVAAAAVFVLQLAVIRHSRGSAVDAACAEHWGYFRSLGSTQAEIVATFLRAPWRVAFELVWPPEKLWTPARVLLLAGAFPLAAGGAFLTCLVPWFAHQLAVQTSDFHKLDAYTGGFVYGPLVWAGVLGLCRLDSSLPREYRRWLAVTALFAAGVGLAGTAGYFRPGLMPSAWSRSVPQALSLIPRGTKLWCDGYLLPYVGLRRYAKRLPNALPDCTFESELFMPDDVLLSLYWTRLAEPKTVSRVTAFLEQNRFRPVYRDRDLVLLRREGAVASDSEAPRPVSIP